MLRILDRYILREVVVSWLGVTGVLLAILLTNQLASVLARAAEAQYPRDLVLKLILLGSLQNVPLILPVGLLLGILLALGRLYHDSEMTALQACGAGSRPVVLPVLGFTVVLAVLLAALSLYVAPAAAGRWLELRSEALRAGQFAPVTSGSFRIFGGGSTVVYAQGAAPDGTLTHVFVERDRDGKLEVALAQRATHAYNEKGDMQVITLYDGERFEGTPGERRFRIVRFAENTIPVRLPALGGGVVKTWGASTHDLLATHGREEIAELHWRIAFPIMALVLACIAIPLSRLRPRQGRYARIGYAILIFFVYINLATGGQQALARGAIPLWYGLWWVHAAVVLLAAGILLVPQWLSRVRYRRNQRALAAAA